MAKDAILSTPHPKEEGQHKDQDPPKEGTHQKALHKAAVTENTENQKKRQDAIDHHPHHQAHHQTVTVANHQKEKEKITNTSNQTLVPFQKPKPSTSLHKN